jgi:MoaA/NifB/PqqE/SkfB family radical SAM enzyme
MRPWHKEIVSINFCLTSRCNRRCPDCCVGVGLSVHGSKQEGRDQTWEEIERAGKLIGKIWRITISGGEASFHEQFAEFAPRLRSAFDCETMWIETNAYGFRRTPEAFLHFDRIIVTRYGPEARAYGERETGGPNDADIRYMEQYLSDRGLRDRLISGDFPHWPRKYRGPANSCDRGGGGSIAYWDGLIYPCCTAQGMKGAAGLSGSLAAVAASSCRTRSRCWRKRVCASSAPRTASAWAWSA